MLPRALLLSSLLAASALACGPTANSGRGTTTPASTATASSFSHELTVPPSAKSLDAMRALETMGDAGDVEAAWYRAHYLLDLFDAARFGHNAMSRDLLAEIAGRPRSSMQGPAATQAIAELVVLETDRVLELDRQHAEGLRARVLASYDAAGPAKRNQVAQAMQELKSVQSKGGPLAVNATLRLFGYCRSALSDAQHFARQGQRIALSHCLYPLFESDPEPYFADSPGERPPPPSLGRILERQAGLLDRADAARLSQAIAEQQDWLAEFTKTATLAPVLDPLALRLASVDRAEPYDDYPLIGSETEKVANVASRMLADGRHTLATALASEKSGSDLVAIASLASRAGAQALALLVATQQTLRVPRGDYWSDALEEDTVMRAGQIIVSLAPMDTAGDGRHQQANEAKATSWSQRHAQLTLQLIVAPQSWTLASPQGRLARFAIGDVEKSPASSLREILKQVRSAYPDERGLILVSQGGASVGALTLAAEAASRDEAGHPLFTKLALAASASKVRPGSSLLARVKRRARVEVVAQPSGMAPGTSSALRCYRRLADRAKAQTGSVRLELRDDGSVLAKGASRRLQECAQGAFAETMKADKVAAVTVSFSAKPK